MSRRIELVAVLSAILLTAFNLRIGFVAPGPVIDAMRADTGMNSAVAGILTTIPFICMGLFAFVGGPLIHRYGTKHVVTMGLALIVIGTILRSLMPTATLVLAATSPIGIGVALVGVALPVVVKIHYPGCPGAVTGAYVASMSLGIALVGVSLIPIADAFGSWREAFLFTAIPAALAFVVWVLTRIQGFGTQGSRANKFEQRAGLFTRLRGGSPRPQVVLLAAVFGLQSFCFAAIVGWAPAIYHDGGWDIQTAALTTTIIGIVNIFAALTLPMVSDGGDRRHWLAATLLIQATGLLCIALFGTTVGWLWLVLFASGNGSTFAMMLALSIDLCEQPRTAANSREQPRTAANSREQPLMLPCG